MSRGPFVYTSKKSFIVYFAALLNLKISKFISISVSHGLYPTEPSKLKVYLLKEILFHHYFLQRFLLFYFTPDKFHSEEKIIMTDMSREGLFGRIKDTA